MLSNTFSISIQEIVLLITVGAATYSMGHIMGKKQDKTTCEQNLKGLYATINTLEVLLKEVGVKLDTGLQNLQRQIDDIKKSMDTILRRNEDVKIKS